MTRTNLETTMILIEHCKNEKDKTERILCWIDSKEYYDLEEHKRCEYMNPLTRGINAKETRIYCNYQFNRSDECEKRMREDYLNTIKDLMHGKKK